MKRGFVIASVLLVAVNLWAGDPWKDKSYKDLDAKDVQKILNDSPWAKRIEIEREEKEHEGLEAPEGAPTIGKAGGESEEEDEEHEEKGRGREKDDEDKDKDQARFIVRWVSSRTLREASVRGQVLQKQISEADAEKFLPPAPDDYQLALVGSDMTLFQAVDQSTLKDKSYLLAKKSKQRITPSRVGIVHSSDGKRINAIVFHFPKKGTTGQAVIPNDEKELKFVSHAGATEIKTHFDPQKMVDNLGIDL